MQELVSNPFLIPLLAFLVLALIAAVWFFWVLTKERVKTYQNASAFKGTFLPRAPELPSQRHKDILAASAGYSPKPRDERRAELAAQILAAIVSREKINSDTSAAFAVRSALKIADELMGQLGDAPVKPCHSPVVDGRGKPYDPTKVSLFYRDESGRIKPIEKSKYTS